MLAYIGTRYLHVWKRTIFNILDPDGTEKRAKKRSGHVAPRSLTCAGECKRWRLRPTSASLRINLLDAGRLQKGVELQGSPRGSLAAHSQREHPFRPSAVAGCARYLSTYPHHSRTAYLRHHVTVPEVLCPGQRTIAARSLQRNPFQLMHHVNTYLYTFLSLKWLHYCPW